MSYKVSIDAGHSKNTQGKQSCKLTEDLYIDGKLVRKKGQVIKENEFNTLCAKALASALQRQGIQTKFVNDITGNTDTALSARAQRANSWGSDIHISCHYNAIGSCASWQTKCHGVLVLKTANCSSKSTTLANKVHAAIRNNYSHSYGVGVDKDWSGFTLAILRQTNMPAILIEYGFMDYKEEALKMLNPKWYIKLAEDTCKGICNYFGITYKAANNVEDKPVIEPTPVQPKPSESTQSGKYIVRYLQRSLNADYGCNLAVDGSYGPKTKAAVKSHLIKRGSKGEFVGWLQMALNNRIKAGLAIDNSFGPATATALKIYQAKRGLTPDAICGIKTVHAIVND